MSECHRCGATISRGYVLDGAVHPFENWVCGDCLKDTDEVIDP